MEPYIGEIRLFGFNFAPPGWAFCSGQILPINTNEALFAILGTTYGGNGVTNFALPDLRGRLAVHPGQGPGLSYYQLGEIVGTESVTLITTEMPTHSHALLASQNAATTTSPGSGVVHAAVSGDTLYRTAGSSVGMSGTTDVAGSGQAHENRMPGLCLNYCIAIDGIFPARN